MPTRILNKKNSVYFKARRIQRAWRSHRNKKDKIKTAGDVKKVIQSQTPSSVIIQETDFSLTGQNALGIGGPTVQHVLSDIEFSNSNDHPNARKSKRITVGHVKCRCMLTCGDATNLCRVMVVRNKDPMTAAAFNPKLMFQMNNQVGPQPDQMFAEPNLRYVEVKYDRVFNLQLSAADSAAVRPSTTYFQFSVPIHETWKYYTETNNTSELTRNMKDYYIVAFSDSLIVPNPTFKCVSYTWFKNHTR